MKRYYRELPFRICLALLSLYVFVLASSAMFGSREVVAWVISIEVLIILVAAVGLYVGVRGRADAVASMLSLLAGLVAAVVYITAPSQLGLFDWHESNYKQSLEITMLAGSFCIVLLITFPYVVKCAVSFSYLAMMRYMGTQPVVPLNGTTKQTKSTVEKQS